MIYQLIDRLHILIVIVDYVIIDFFWSFPHNLGIDFGKWIILSWRCEYNWDLLLFLGMHRYTFFSSIDYNTSSQCWHWTPIQQRCSLFPNMSSVLDSGIVFIKRQLEARDWTNNCVTVVDRGSSEVCNIIDKESINEGLPCCGLYLGQK